MSNGYDAKQLEIDEAMVALNRPPPPVVSWLKGQMPGALPENHNREMSKAGTCKCQWCTATRDWHARLAQWERDHPENAARWLELREQYIEHEKTIEARKWSADEWNYRTLINQGCAPRTIDAIRRELDERGCLKRAREWLLDGLAWSLVLCGRPGCGKSTAAAWAAHQLAMRKFSPRWVRCVSMVDKPMFGFEAQLEKSKCQDAGILVLDDIGAGARETEAKLWLGWLDDVLDFRHGHRRRTIITSNLPEKALKAWFGPRLSDRLGQGVFHETAEKSLRSPP